MTTKYKYQRIKDSHDPRDFTYGATAPIELPLVVDMRAHCSPVEDQGELGSCTGNAIVGALEYLENVQNQSFINLSRLFVYYNERVIEGTVNQDAGAMIRDGIKAIARYGVCSEDVWPYNVATFTNRPSLEAYQSAEQHKAIEYRRVMQSADDIQHALAAGFPVVCGIILFSQFESDHVISTGMVSMPDMAREQNLGGHAVLCVGYNRTTRQYIMRNSWGESFGDKGYFYLPFDYLHSPQLADDFWTVSRLS